MGNPTGIINVHGRVQISEGVVDVRGGDGFWCLFVQVQRALLHARASGLMAG